MKRILIFAAAAMTLLACQKNNPVNVPAEDTGMLSISLTQGDAVTKAAYTNVLDEEKAEKKVSVLVFSKRNNRLDAYKEIASTSAECKFRLTTGEKIVYAVVNGPSLASVTSIDELKAVVDNLASTTIAANGLTMIGTTNATVSLASEATVEVAVNRLVSRVVINKIENNLPAQYGKIRVESVFLANAYSKSTLGGTPSEMVNVDGYADAAKTSPIGKNGTQGLCAAYLFKTVGQDILVGSSLDTPYILYAQPNSTDVLTKFLIYVTYGGDLSGYYPIPLKNKLEANTTYTLSVKLNNPPVPNPDDPFELNGLNVTIKVNNWTTGDEYQVEM